MNRDKAFPLRGRWASAACSDEVEKKKFSSTEKRSETSYLISQLTLTADATVSHRPYKGKPGLHLFLLITKLQN